MIELKLKIAGQWVYDGLFASWKDAWMSVLERKISIHDAKLERAA